MSHNGAGVGNLTRSLAISGRSCTVNAVAPGISNIRDERDRAVRRRAARVPRWGGADQEAPQDAGRIARMIVFLASDQNDFITGQVFSVTTGNAALG
jgi:citronellol/citronellal dehydrogenase